MAEASEPEDDGAAAPAQAPVPVTQEAVITELCTDPMGKALYERAQYKVAINALVNQRAELFARIRELESQKTPEPKKEGRADG